MRLSQRLIAAAVLISLSGALAGCGGGGLSNWDPTDMLDWLDTKKKLPGDRKPVFPDGVPGLEQGVPKDLYKGSAQEQADQQKAQAASHHHAAAGSAGGASGAAGGCRAAACAASRPTLATIRRTLPGAVAGWQLHALISVFRPARMRRDSTIRA
jgi:hypothetical protein